MPATTVSSKRSTPDSHPEQAPVILYMSAMRYGTFVGALVGAGLELGTTLGPLLGSMEGMSLGKAVAAASSSCTSRRLSFSTPVGSKKAASVMVRPTGSQTFAAFTLYTCSITSPIVKATLSDTGISRSRVR